MKDVWQMIDDDTELDRENRTKVHRPPYRPETWHERRANALKEMLPAFTAESLARAKAPGELTEKQATGLSAPQRELLSNLSALFLSDEERDPNELMIRQAYRLTAKKHTSLTMRDVISWMDEGHENFSSAFVEALRALGSSVIQLYRPDVMLKIGQQALAGKTKDRELFVKVSGDLVQEDGPKAIAGVIVLPEVEAVGDGHGEERPA